MNDSLQKNTLHFPLSSHANKFVFEQQLEFDLQNMDTIPPLSASESGLSSFISTQHTDIQPEKRAESQFDWFFCIYFLLLFLLVLIKTTSNKTLGLNMKILLRSKSASMLMKEENFLNPSTLIFVFLFICLGFTLLFDSILPFMYFSDVEYENILYIFVGFSIFMLIKIIAILITGLFFNISSLTTEYIQTFLLIDYGFIFFCSPFFLLYNYTTNIVLWYFLLGAVILFFIYRIMRGFLIFRSKIPLYEFFLYFCTLEVLPIMVILKFVVKYF